MSVYNAERYLQEAIESILSQTFKNFEFIIINDGSSDRSIDIINSFSDDRIVLIDQVNTGLPTALNNGIKMSKSGYIARMDADDISLPSRLKEQYDYLEKNNEVIAVGTHANVIDMNGNFVYTLKQPVTWEEVKRIFPETPFIHPSVMFRKRQFTQVEGYMDIPIAEDVTLFIKLAKIGKLENLDKILLNYRVSPFSISRKSKKTNKIVKEIKSNFVEGGQILDDDIHRLQLSIDRSSSRIRHYHYHILLAKKYLWNNYQPKLARKNLQNAFKYKRLDVEIYLLFLFSFFPAKAVKILYKRLKSI